MSLELCAKAVTDEDICILPTETVYGIACSALSSEAIKKVYQLKGRPATNPLIVHVLNHSHAAKLAHTNLLSKKLADVFWPGPLTIILPKKNCIPLEITAGLSTVAIRSPKHPLFRKLLIKTSLPLAAPSANRSNYLSPTSYKQAIDGFAKYILPSLDGGDCEIGIESTVLDLTSTIPSILRPGPINQNSIEEVIGKKVECNDLIQKVGAKKSPGQSEKHYAPLTPLLLHSSTQKMSTYDSFLDDDIVILPSKMHFVNSSFEGVRVLYLSELENPNEITKNLFKTLNEADQLKGHAIHISLFPFSENILSAVNDRLIRAASKRI